MSAPTDDGIYDGLVPVLVQCFAIILFGYLSGRLGLVESSAGLKKFVTYFALPAVAFKSLATLKLTAVNWRFLGAVFLAKSGIFVTVALLTLFLLPRPRCYAMAGLYAIASSQSNDFALGYPLISRLYAHTHPTFSHYLYLIAPIQLVLLNPIGIALMEHGSNREDGPPRSLPRKILSGLAGVFRNPVVSMPLLGLAWSLATDGSPPPRTAAGLVDSLAEAFSASALYLLGLGLAERTGAPSERGALVPALLVSAKILLVPLLLRQTVLLLAVGNSPAETGAFAGFGFLYGMLPAAPNVFVFAAQYALPAGAVSAAVVAGTLLSAPCLFVSATVAELSAAGLEDALATLGKTVVCAGAFGGLCSLWVLLVLSRKISRVTHGATFCLVSAQLLVGLGGVLWFAADSTYVGYLQSALSLCGTFASRIWTALLAVLLATLHWRSLCFVLRVRRIAILLGFGASVVVACAVCLDVTRGAVRFRGTDPNFRLGRTQANVAAGLLTVTLLVTVAALVVQQRSRFRTRGYAPLRGSNDEEEGAVPRPPTPGSTVHEGGDGSVLPSHESRDRSQSPQATSFPTSDSKPDGCTGDCETCDNCSGDEEPRPALLDLEDILTVPSKVRGHRSKAHKGKKHLSINCTDSDESPIPSTSAGRPEDGLCGPEFDCDKGRIKECLAAVETYGHRIAPDEESDPAEDEEEDPHQVFRHVVLLILLSGSMVVGLAASFWRPSTDAPTGILVELEFVDALLNYGQGVLSFAVFGLDPSYMIRLLRSLWKRITCRTAPTDSQASTETGHTTARPGSRR